MKLFVQSTPQCFEPALAPPSRARTARPSRGCRKTTNGGLIWIKATGLRALNMLVRVKMPQASFSGRVQTV